MNNTFLPIDGLLIDLPADELEDWNELRLREAHEHDIHLDEMPPTMVEFCRDGNVFLHCDLPEGGMMVDCIEQMKLHPGLVHPLKQQRPKLTNAGSASCVADMCGCMPVMCQLCAKWQQPCSQMNSKKVSEAHMHVPVVRQMTAAMQPDEFQACKQNTHACASCA